MFIIEEVRRNDDAQSWNPLFQKLNLDSHKRTECLTLKAAKSPENRNLNRYRDVLPYDHSRVLLEPNGSTPRYINANHVELAGIGHKYILTQGPLPNTCAHFWQMVWEQQSSTVIMLNKILEKNAIKCHPYWPMGESEVAEFGSFRITNETETMKSSYIVRKFVVKNTKTGESRSVKHFHYIMWPDFGVPDDPESFLLFLYDIQKSGAFEPEAGAPVIHCSAGIGRSGTFCLVDSALTKVEQDSSVDNLSIKEMLLDLRTQRVGLIQTAEQLRFSYLAIIYGVHRLLPDVFANLEEEDVAKPNGESEEDNEPPPLPPRPSRRDDNASLPHGTKRPNEDDVAEEDERQKRMLKQLNNLDDSSDGSEEDEIIDLDASDYDELEDSDTGTTSATSSAAINVVSPRKPLPTLPSSEEESEEDNVTDTTTEIASPLPDAWTDRVSPLDNDNVTEGTSAAEADADGDDINEPSQTTHASSDFSKGVKASDDQQLLHRQRREERKLHTAKIVNNIKEKISSKEHHAASQAMWVKSAVAVGVCVGLFAIYKWVV